MLIFNITKTKEFEMSTKTRISATKLAKRNRPENREKALRINFPSMSVEQIKEIIAGIK